MDNNDTNAVTSPIPDVLLYASDIGMLRSPYTECLKNSCTVVFQMLLCSDFYENVNIFQG
jgi:hypothetical protein